MPSNSQRLVDGLLEDGRTRFSAVRSEINSLKSAAERFAAAAKEYGKYMPPELLKEIKAVAAKVQAFDPESLRQATGFKTAPAKGAVASVSQLKRALTAGSGLSNWQSDHEGWGGDMDSEEVATQIADDYGIQIDPKRLHLYVFTRDTDNRSELCYVNVAAFPGGIYLVDAATDRVSGFDGLYKTVEEFQERIAAL